MINFVPTSSKINMYDIATQVKKKYQQGDIHHALSVPAAASSTSRVPAAVSSTPRDILFDLRQTSAANINDDNIRKKLTDFGEEA